MTRKVVYLMSGVAHLPYLTVSLQSLRRHWNGLVDIYAWTESFEIASRIGRDPNLDASVYCRQVEYRGKNAQFLDKIRLMQSLQSDTNLYLDADTIITRPIDHLFDLAEKFTFAATQFGNWTTAGGIIKGRIERLRAFPTIDQTLIDSVTTIVWASLNGGVFACQPSSPVLLLWEEYTKAAVEDVFIADEAVLHIMQPKFMSSGQMTVALGGFWNCSPRHQPAELKDSDVAIWHGHGDCFARSEKSQKGVDMWLPLWKRCLEENVGGAREWQGKTPNKFIDALMRDF